ncbi:MAG TPA: inositol monophosphatase [Phycisphaerales bacterium]|nr:inositol monophosphatase [Phycisphaerales bacterium]
MLEIAKQIALEAGALLKEGQEKGFSLDRKSTSIDLVTEYDQLAEKLVVSSLVKAFPDHGLVAEEGSSRECRSAEGYRWYIDPLDGTNNFAHHIPQFSVSIALYKEDEPEIGVVCDPMRGELFWAQRGQGAFVNGRRLQVSDAPKVGDSILASGFPYDRHTDVVDNLEQLGRFIKMCQGFRRFGSCALDLAFLAAGRYDGFWEFKLSSWDLAAGILLVQEAGGKVTRIDGQPMGYLTERNHIVASNGLIHQEMLDTLAPTLTPAHLKTGDPVL